MQTETVLKNKLLITGETNPKNLKGENSL